MIMGLFHELMMKSYKTNDKLFIEYNNKDIAQTQ